MAGIRVDCENLKSFVARALETVGVTSEAAQIAANVLVTADMRGVRTHGTRQLRGYVKHIRSGGMDPKADIEILGEGAIWALIDGHAGLGVFTAFKSMRRAISKARENVVGVVVRNSNHFGAAGYYAMMAAKEDMVGLAMSNGDPTMSAPGAVGRVLSNSPLAYAIPTGRGTPLALDIALSVVAGVKIHQAAREQRSVPEGWIVDKQGVPTTSPADFEDGGAHVPIGGYKGFGLALMVEILAGVMTGAGVTDEVTSFVQQPSRASNVGHFLMAIDVAALMPRDVFKARVDGLAHKIKAPPRIEGVESVYLPGEIELEEEEKAKSQGVLLDEMTIGNLQVLAQELGLTRTAFERLLAR